MLRLDGMAVGPFEVNCYILTGEGNAALVVDPGSESMRIEEVLRGRGLTVAAYVLTHGHADHVSALAPLTRAFPAPVCLHPSDAAWAFSSRNRIEPFYEAPDAPESPVREVRDGSTWTDGGIRYTVFETPGHTPGGVCYYFPAIKALMTGDTLFAGSAGRTDLPGGDFASLERSLRRLRSFEDDVTVYPGHGPSTRMGDEKQHNPFLERQSGQEESC